MLDGPFNTHNSCSRAKDAPGSKTNYPTLGAGPDSRSVAGHITTAVRLAPRHPLASAVEVVVMPKFRAGAARRLHVLIRHLELSPGKSTPGDFLIGLAGTKRKPIALDNPDVWALFARSALTLDEKDEMDI